MIAIQIPQTEYLPLTASRRFSFELPQADAFGGAAYGQKHGPAIAVVGAIGSIGVGMSIGGVIGGLMIAGGIASGIGALTGNKFLSNLGMGLGLAGGVAGAFSSAGGGFLDYNPFSNGLGGSELGMGMSQFGDKIGNWFKDFTGGTNISTGMDGVTQVGDVINAPANEALNQASGGLLNNPILGEDSSMVANLTGNGGPGVNLANYSGGGPGIDLGSVASAAGSSGGSSGGLLGDMWGKLNNSGPLLNALGGAADAYQKQPLIDAETDRSKALTDQTEWATEKDKQRYQNMQYQDVAAPGFNSGGFQQPGSSGGQNTYVIFDKASGKVLSLTPDQYLAYQQQQAQGAAA